MTSCSFRELLLPCPFQSIQWRPRPLQCLDGTNICQHIKLVWNDWQVPLPSIKLIRVGRGLVKTFRKYNVFLKFEKPLKFSSYHCCKYKLAVLGWTFVRFSYFNQSIACFIFEYFIIKLQMFNTNLNFRTSLTSSNRLDKPKSGHWFKFTNQLFKPTTISTCLSAWGWGCFKWTPCYMRRLR